MRSVYAKIFAWSLVMLFVLTALFFLISNQIEMRLGTNEVFRNVITFELEQTTQAYKTGGRAGAAEVISRLNRIMKWRHYVLDGDGVELSTGVNRSDLIARLNGHWNQPVRTPDGLVIGWRVPGNPNRLIAEAPVSFGLLSLIPYNALILLTVAALAWPLALHFGSPLRSLARIVDRFGQGDLSVRARSTRRDEIGILARSFDRMAERIETLLTAERRLLQDVSHELRSPLARLSFATELIATEPDRDKAIARIRKEVSRLSMLVGSLIQMTRAEGDPASGQRKEFRLDVMVQDLVEDCTVEATARGSGLVLAESDGVPVTGDPELIRRAVENVLRNAIRHSPQGGTVNVRVGNDSGFAQIQIADEGPGVPQQELAKIFHPFYRVDDSRTASTGGIGLGLAIAMRAVKLHNGSIEAKNILPGLLVTIRIPPA